MSALPADPAPRRRKRLRPPRVRPFAPPPPRWPDSQRLIVRLADLGAWREAYPILQERGPDSAEFRALCLRVIGAGRCPVCGQTYLAYSRRLHYCSDTCRRRAQNDGRYGELPGRRFTSGRTFGKMLSHGGR